MVRQKRMGRDWQHDHLIGDDEPARASEDGFSAEEEEFINRYLKEVTYGY